MTDKSIEQLKSEIAYEEHQGIHTYHTCPFCGNNPTRAGKCSACLKKNLTQKEAK